MSCAPTQPLCFIAGTDFFFDLQYLASDKETPIDLTGCTATMQLLTADTDETAVITLTGGITDAVNGYMRFELDNTQTQTLLPFSEKTARFVSDILIEYTDGTKEVILRADSTIEQGRTR